MSDEQNGQSQGTTQDDASTAAATMTPVQNDVARLKAAIAALEESGKELFQDEIAALKQKLVGLEEKAKAEAAATVEAERTFLQKYGQAAAHTVEITLLVAIIGKLFGVL